MRAQPRLSIRGLSVQYDLGHRGAGRVHAASDLDLDIGAGQLVALLGESGCGKSALAAALLGLLPPTARITGSAHLGGPAGVDILSVSAAQFRADIAGRRMALVPPSAISRLTPFRTGHALLDETLRHLRTELRGRSAARRRARRETTADLAAAVELSPELLDRYPHQLSGGQAQRLALALALAGEPEVIIADEPTIGLDEELSRTTVAMLHDRAAHGTAVLLITHDIDAVRDHADVVAVMYAAQIVETGPATQVLSTPAHPYTQGLLAALPSGGLHPIAGTAPPLREVPSGCTFRPRCPHPQACHHPDGLRPVTTTTTDQPWLTRCGR